MQGPAIREIRPVGRNAPKPFSANPAIMEEIMRLSSRTSSRLGGGHPLPIPLPLDAVSISAPRSLAFPIHITGYRYNRIVVSINQTLL